MTAERDGKCAAEQFRTEHVLGTQPLGDLVAIVEQAAGVDVAVLDVGPDEHGLTMRDPDRGTVLIGVARTLHPMRQRSTLAHELAHVVFEDWQDVDSRHDAASNWSDRRPQEIRADAFARHLLLPVAGLTTLLGNQQNLTLAALSSIVQRFLVSPAIGAIALHQAAYIDAATKQDWMALTSSRLATKFGWADQYRALQAESNQRRAPQRLLARAIAGYQAGVLSARAIATLRGLPLSQVKSELEDAGVIPPERNVAWAEPTDLPDAHVDLADLDADLAAEDNSYQPGDATHDDDPAGRDR